MVSPEQREGDTTPCMDGLHAGPSKGTPGDSEGPLGTPGDPWGHGLCFHTEEQVENS